MAPLIMPAMSRLRLSPVLSAGSFGQRAVFLLVPVFAVLAAGAVLSIPGSAIDQERARGADTDTPSKAVLGFAGGL